MILSFDFKLSPMIDSKPNELAALERLLYLNEFRNIYINGWNAMEKKWTCWMWKAVVENETNKYWQVNSIDKVATNNQLWKHFNLRQWEASASKREKYILSQFLKGKFFSTFVAEYDKMLNLMW